MKALKVTVYGRKKKLSFAIQKPELFNEQKKAETGHRNELLCCICSKEGDILQQRREETK